MCEERDIYQDSLPQHNNISILERKILFLLKNIYIHSEESLGRALHKYNYCPIHRALQ